MFALLDPSEVLVPQGRIAMIEADPSPATLPSAPPSVVSYVQGVSLASVLQMLQLERMSCLLEVTAEDRFGTLTLVNGELVDAETEDAEGEDAVCHILSWRRPHITILDGVTLFRNTVKSPISTLIVEAVRRQDETADGASDWERGNRPVTGELKINRATGRRSAVDAVSDWLWLVETLVVGGASAATVFQAVDGRILAQASERGGPIADASTTTPDAFDSVVRAASHWARQSYPTIDEVEFRLGDQHALICPLDRRHNTYVCALFARSESLALARSAIRTIRR